MERAGPAEKAPPAGACAALGPAAQRCASVCCMWPNETLQADFPDLFHRRLISQQAVRRVE